jgi:hypothetical protein
VPEHIKLPGFSKRASELAERSFDFQSSKFIEVREDNSVRTQQHYWRESDKNSGADKR